MSVLRSLHQCGVDMAQGYAVGMPRLHLPRTLPSSFAKPEQEEKRLSEV